MDTKQRLTRRARVADKTMFYLINHALKQLRSRLTY